MCGREARVELQSLLELINGFSVFSLEGQDEAQVLIPFHPERVDCERCGGLVEGLLRPTEIQQVDCVSLPCHDRIGVQFDTAPELELGAVPVPLVCHQSAAEIGVSLGNAVVHFESARSCRYELGICLTRRHRLEESEPEIARGYSGVRPRICGIELDGPLERLKGQVVTIECVLVPVEGPEEVCVVGFEIAAMPLCLRFLPWAQRGTQCTRYVHSDLGLNRKHVFQVAIECLGPKVQIAPGVDELHDYAQAVRCTPHAALQDRTDVQCGRDVPKAVGRILVAHDRRGVHIDHRGNVLRLGPAPYLTDEQLQEAVSTLGEVVA